jgi:hypothetical protein
VHVAGSVFCGLVDERVDEPDERCVGDPVVDLEVVDVVALLLLLVPLDRPQLGADPDVEGLARAAKAPDLGGKGVPGRDREVDGVAGREPQLVEPAGARPAGSGRRLRASPAGR